MNTNKMGSAIVAIVVSTSFLVPVVGAQEPAPAPAAPVTAPATKIYLSMPPARVDVEFKPLLEFTPAVSVSPGGRRALEAYVAERTRDAAEALTAEVRQAIQATLGDQATVTESPLGTLDDKSAGAALAALPFMQRRGAPVTLIVRDIALAADHAGTVVNPNPKNTANTGLFDSFANVGRSLSNISGKKALTFEGATRLTYGMSYKLYATSTGELLRDGKIGPVSVETPVWAGSWTFPPNESLFETTCVNYVCDSKFSPEKAAQHITDPRPDILPAAIAQLGPKVKEAVAKSFTDWPELIAAGQELAAKR